MWVYDIENGKELFLIGLDGINGSGGGISKKRIIIKSDTIPEASEKTYKLIYIYAGESNGTYHHGYIYECIADVEYSLKYTPDPDDHDNKRDIAFNFVSPYTSDSQAMQAWLKNVIQLDKQDISFTQVASGSIIRKTFDDDRADSMWNVILRDKDGNVLYQSERGIYTLDLESFGFTFIWPNDYYLVDVPSSFTIEWSVASTSNYRWEQLDVQPNGSGGDLSIYQLKMNMTQDPNSTSQGTYPSSYALSKAIDSVKNTLTLFDGNTGTVLDTHANLGTIIIFKNGQQIYEGADRDYTINGSIITFAEPLVETDVIAVVNNNLVGLQLSAVATSGDYNDLINKPVIKFTNVTASNWVSDSTYSNFSYKCELNCEGVTADDYATVLFSSTDVNNGNYANVCETGTNTVTIYSKVNTSTTIPKVVIIR